MDGKEQIPPSQLEELEKLTLACMMAKVTNPEMFVSGFDADDQGIEEPIDPTLPGEVLLKAAEEGDESLAEKLLVEDPFLVDYKDKDGYTGLHRAAYSDNANIIRLLISKGAKVDEVTEDGWTALHSACHWNSYKAVRELVNCNASVNAKTDGGHTPLHVASNQQARESMIILISSPGIDLTVKNKVGDTPLDVAKRSGRFANLFDVASDSVNKL